MEERDNTEMIHRYLRGELSSDEEQDFLTQVAADESLQQELELYRDIQRGIELDASRDLKERLRLHEQRHHKKFSAQWLWKVAASLLLAATIGYLIFHQSHKSGEEIFEQYYEPYPNIVHPLNRSDEVVSEKGLYYYENGDYEMAIRLLTEKLKSGPENSAFLFYLAQSYLAKRQPAEAIPYLKKVSKTSEFSEPADWYLALAQLKTGDLEKAKADFQKIARSRSSYAERAKEILKAL